jgi:hypothetical protein
LFRQPAGDHFMGDGFALFRIAQPLFDETGVVVLQVEILVDSFVENVAAITLLGARQLVDLLQFQRGGFKLTGLIVVIAVRLQRLNDLRGGQFTRGLSGSARGVS